MAMTRLILLLLAVSALSGCQTFSRWFSSSPRLTGKAEAIISDVIAPNHLYVGEGNMQRKVFLLGIASMDPNHENYPHVMKALEILKGKEVRIRFPGKNFWKPGPAAISNWIKNSPGKRPGSDRASKPGAPATWGVCGRLKSSAGKSAKGARAPATPASNCSRAK